MSGCKLLNSATSLPLPLVSGVADAVRFMFAELVPYVTLAPGSSELGSHQICAVVSFTSCGIGPATIDTAVCEVLTLGADVLGAELLGCAGALACSPACLVWNDACSDCAPVPVPCPCADSAFT